MSSGAAALRQGLAFQVGLSFIVKAFGALAAFVLTLAVGRILGAEESGYFFWTMSLVTLLGAIGRVGLNSTVVRFTGVAQSEGDQGAIRQILIRALCIAAVCSLVFAIALYTFAPALAEGPLQKPGLADVLVASAPMIVLIALYNLVASSLQGQGKPLLSILILSVLAPIGLTAAALLLAPADAAAMGALWSLAGGVTLVAGLMLALHGRRGAPLNQVSWPMIFASCLPLWIVVVMGQCVQWSGQLVAGAWVEVAELGQLAVAQRCSLIISLVLMAVNVVVAPRFAAHYKAGEMDRLERVALASVRMMVMAALPILLVFLVWPHRVMGLFGAGFVGGADLLRILAVGQFINVATGSVSWLLSMSGHERDLRNVVLLTGPLAILLALVLTPLLGAAGAALSTAIALSLQNLLAVLMVKKRLGFNTLGIWRSGGTDGG